MNRCCYNWKPGIVDPESERIIWRSSTSMDFCATDLILVNDIVKASCKDKIRRLILMADLSVIRLIESIFKPTVLPD